MTQRATSPPSDIKARRESRTVQITWEPGHVGTYETKELRAACCCAQCVDEHTGRRILDVDAIPEDIHVTEMELVGNYAIRFRFSDGHDLGIYSWPQLRALCPCPKCNPHAGD